LDEDAVDEAAHQGDTKAVTGRARSERRFSPMSVVEHLDAERVGFGPDGEFDRSRMVDIVGVLDGVGSSFVDRKDGLRLPVG